MSEEKEQLNDKKKIVISANFTIGLIEPSVSYWINKFGMAAELEFGSYNQLHQELLDPDSKFATNDNGVNLLFLKVDDLLNLTEKYAHPRVSEHESLTQELESIIDELLATIGSFMKQTSTPMLVVTCPSSPKFANDSQLGETLIRFENKVNNTVNKISGAYNLSHSEVLKKYPVEDYYEELGEYIGHIPYTQSFFISLGTMAFRKVYSILSKPYKAISVDCDNTLWTGVVGEDGLSGILIDERRVWLQLFLIEQYNAGMIICLCSKNNPEDVDEVFDKRDDMLLKREHISHSKVNWIPKSQNIKSLAEDLNIGIDSFIFIDDSPVECEEVRTSWPEVLAINLPDNLERIKVAFQNMWAFDHLKVTAEDKKRTEFYQSSRKREQVLNNTADYAEFIDNLGIDISINKLTENDIARASQLTQRVNQFNLSTVRRTEAEIEQLLHNANYDCFVVKVNDRFGEYGTVGLVICNKEQEHYSIDTFLLSCRALGRGVEYSMLSHVGKLAKENNICNVQIRCLATQKNTPIRDFICLIGGDKVVIESDNVIGSLTSEYVSEIDFKAFIDNKSKQKQTENKEKNKSDTNNKSTTKNKASRTDTLIEISNNLTNVLNIKDAVYPKKERLKQRQFEGVHEKDSTAQKLYEVWSEVLNEENISDDDKFFELGGKSILIPLIVIHMQKRYDIEIKIVDIFQYPTIRSLSDYLDKSGQNSKPEQRIETTKKRSNTLRMKQKRAMDIRKQLKKG